MRLFLFLTVLLAFIASTYATPFKKLSKELGSNSQLQSESESESGLQPEFESNFLAIPSIAPGQPYYVNCSTCVTDPISGYDDCCSNNGACDSTRNLCVCDHQYTTHPAPPTNNKYCNYHEKPWVKSIVLQAIPITGLLGAAEFDMGNTGWGLGQLFLLIGPCILMCICIPIFKDSDGASSTVAGCGMCLMVLGYLAAVGWWIADIVLIAQNQRTDGNGVNLFN
jgi:hypothetical protein